jgi:4-hydroxy-tetrahydrodipicolinate synthase
VANSAHIATFPTRRYTECRQLLVPHRSNVVRHLSAAIHDGAGRHHHRAHTKALRAAQMSAGIEFTHCRVSPVISTATPWEVGARPLTPLSRRAQIPSIEYGVRICLAAGAVPVERESPMPQSLPHHLESGLWSVLPTPFHGPDLAVDHGSLAKLAGGISAPGMLRGLVVLGVFGESAVLTGPERAEVLRTVRDHAGGLPLVVGITGTDTDACRASAAELGAVAGADGRAVMVQVNSPDPDAVRRHLDAVHQACELPVVVQDYPVVSGVTIEPAALAEAVESLPFVAAVKSECPPTGAVIADQTARVRVPVFGGLGGLGLLDELVAGAAGAMTGFSYPEAIAGALRGWRDGGFEAARAAYSPWLPLVNFEAQARIGLSIRKHIWRYRGLVDDPAVRPPAPDMPPGLEPILAVHLRALPDLEGSAGAVEGSPRA